MEMCTLTMATCITTMETCIETMGTCIETMETCTATMGTCIATNGIDTGTMIAQKFTEKKEGSPEYLCYSSGCRVENHSMKLLPCFHVFCLEYLEKETTSNNRNWRYACPECKLQFLVPERNLGNLPGNFFGRRLGELRQVLGKPTPECCEVCEMPAGKGKAEGGGEWNPASLAFCTVCSQHMCNSCVGLHDKMRLSRSHKVLLSEKKNQQLGELLKASPRKCELHQTEVESLYCQDCDVPMCSRCLALDKHRKHVFLPVKRVADARRQQILEDLSWIEDRIKEARKLLEEVENERNNLMENINNLEIEIETKSEEMKSETKKNAILLQKNIASLGDEHSKDISRILDEVSEGYLESNQLLNDWKRIRNLIPIVASTEMEKDLDAIITQWKQLPRFFQRFEKLPSYSIDQFLDSLKVDMDDDPEHLERKFGRLSPDFERSNEEHSTWDGSLEESLGSEDGTG